MSGGGRKRPPSNVGKENSECGQRVYTVTRFCLFCCFFVVSFGRFVSLKTQRNLFSLVGDGSGRKGAVLASRGVLRSVP